MRSTDSPEIGDQYIFVAIDEETKLVPAFLVGKRTRHTAAFLWGLYKRLAAPTQLTTDRLVLCDQPQFDTDLLDRPFINS